MDETYIKQGEFYKCLTCGMVGNWKAVIVTGMCHAGRRKKHLKKKK